MSDDELVRLRGIRANLDAAMAQIEDAANLVANAAQALVPGRRGGDARAVEILRDAIKDLADARAEVEAVRKFL